MVMYGGGKRPKERSKPPAKGCHNCMHWVRNRGQGDLDAGICVAGDKLKETNREHYCTLHELDVTKIYKRKAK